MRKGFAAVLALGSLIGVGWGSYGLLTLATPGFLLRTLTALSGLMAFLSLRGMLRPLPPSTAHGSAGFATGSEVRDLLPTSLPKPFTGEVWLGALEKRPLVLPTRLALQHGCIVGPTGSGKSRGFFLPNAAVSRRVSCVYADPKSELWRHTGGQHVSRRYAPGEAQSEAFNWIPLCSDARMAELCARAIVESGNTRHTEQAWIDTETAFLAALFAHASTLPEPTVLTAYTLFTRQRQGALLHQLEKSLSLVAQEQANIFRGTHERMRGSIVPVVAARLQFLRDPAVARFCSASLQAPRFAELRQSAQAVYWCLREQDIARLRPLTSVFFTVLLEQLCTEEGVGEEREIAPVLLFLDEFATLGVIPNFATIIALARGRQIGLWLGLQSLSQLEAHYGRPDARTILTNCGVKLALPGLDVETAEYFSRSLGEATIAETRRSWHRHRFQILATSLSDSEDEHARALKTPDEVRRLEEEQILAIIGNRRPLLLTRNWHTTKPFPGRVAALGPARGVSLHAAGASGQPESGRDDDPIPTFPEGLF